MSAESSGILTAAAARLRTAGVDSPRREARLLLAHVLGVRPEALVSGDVPVLDAETSARFEAVLARRTAREPLAYILGTREFWSLEFAVGPDVLVPRPESEIPIEQALRRFPDDEMALRVLDLGTGSGCLLLSFLSERPGAEGLGVDISETALSLAGANAKALGMASRSRFARGDWLNTISGAFDVIFINPPYIPAVELDGLEPEVRNHEPRVALDGGPDGLDAYRRIGPSLVEHLAPEGRVFFEIGRGQADAVKTMFAEMGLRIEGTVCDLAGIPRCLVVGASRAEITPKKELAIETRSG